MHHGSCLCGRIRYEIDQELSDFGYCHCRSCRKASGSAHGANAGFDRTNFELSDPDQLLREYESSPGKIRAFCQNCGSPLFAYLAQNPETMRVRLGTLDSSFSKRAKAHTFVADKADWEVIGDDLPQFDAWASKDVLVQAGSRQP
jgi:hypothetical protein